MYINIDVHIGITDTDTATNAIRNIVAESLYGLRFISEEEAKFILTSYEYHGLFVKKEWIAPFKGKSSNFSTIATMKKRIRKNLKI